MHVLDVNEIFWMTFYTFDRIMEVWWKRWADAVALYIKLLKQTRMQETNQTYTLNSFLEEYFGRWHERVSSANKVLKSLGLIDDVVIRWEDWKVQWHYVRVNYLVNEEKIRNNGMTYNLTTSLENQALVSTTPRETATNALSTQYINAWSTQYKINDFSELFKSYYWVNKWIDEKVCTKLINLKLMQWITLDQIKVALVLYNSEFRVKGWDNYKYVKKFDKWIKEFQPLDDDQIEETLTRIVKLHRERKKSDPKYWQSIPAKTVRRDLCETFWTERVNTIFKSEWATTVLHFT